MSGELNQCSSGNVEITFHCGRNVRHQSTSAKRPRSSLSVASQRPGDSKSSIARWRNAHPGRRTKAYEIEFANQRRNFSPCCCFLHGPCRQHLQSVHQSFFRYPKNLLGGVYFNPQKIQDLGWPRSLSSFRRHPYLLAMVFNLFVSATRKSNRGIQKGLNPLLLPREVPDGFREFVEDASAGQRAM